MIGQHYTIAQRALADCIRIGVERNTKNMRAHTKNMNFSGRNDNDISIQGVLGEYAFCKMVDIPIEPLYDTTCRNVRNDTFDATMPNGMTIDVKTTLSPFADLVVSKWKARRPPSAYALLIIERPNAPNIRSPFDPKETIGITLKGFCKASDILSADHLEKRYQGKMYYCAKQDELMSWDELTGDTSRPHPWDT